MTTTKPANTLTPDRLTALAEDLLHIHQRLHTHGTTIPLNIHNVPRHVFDQVGDDERALSIDSGPFWAADLRLAGGSVCLITTEAPVVEVAGSAEQPTEEEVTA